MSYTRGNNGTSPNLIDRFHKQEYHPNPSRFTRVKPSIPNHHSIDDLDSESNVIHSIRPINDRVVNVLIVVESLPSSGTWRQGVRQTWGRPSHTHSIVFVVPMGDNQADKQLLQESEECGDMMLLKLVSPSTTSSVRLMNYLYWCNRLFKYNYLIRTIDSYYVRVDQLIATLSSYYDTTLLYMGYFKGNVSIGRSDRKWFVCPRLVPHADEGTYLLSRSLIDMFVRHAKYLSYYESEGASVGLWTSPFRNVKLVHNVDFDSFHSRGCWHSLLTTRETRIDNMRSRHARLVGSGVFCEQEVTITRNYKYNWDKPPSQCCNVFI